MIISSSSLYLELEEISLVGMSNSELSFLVEKDPTKVIECNILLRSELEFSSNGCLIASSSSKDYDHHLHHPRIEEECQQVKKKDELKCEGAVSFCSSCSSFVSDEEVGIMMRSGEPRTRTLGGEVEVEVDEDDAGFRTPTSLDHRITIIQQCPPAPRKPKSSPKRKASSSSSTSSTRRQLFPLDLSQKIESLFPPVLLPDLGPKIKKVRER